MNVSSPLPRRCWTKRFSRWPRNRKPPTVRKVSHLESFRLHGAFRPVSSYLDHLSWDFFLDHRTDTSSSFSFSSFRKLCFVFLLSFFVSAYIYTTFFFSFYVYAVSSCTCSPIFSAFCFCDRHPVDWPPVRQFLGNLSRCSSVECNSPRSSLGYRRRRRALTRSASVCVKLSSRIEGSRSNDTRIRAMGTVANLTTCHVWWNIVDGREIM